MAGASPRIDALDALRGVAILAILVANMQSFAFVSAVRWNPTVQGDLTGVNGWLWLATYVLFDGKFMVIFGMLFGASIVLLADSCERRAVSAARIHYRRMAILFPIGLLHAHLVWYGDLLATLSVCGALAFLYRGLAPRRLVTAGLVVFGLGSVGALVVAWSLPDLSPATAAAMRAWWAPPPDAIAWEVARYRGGWLEQMQHRVPTAFAFETSALAVRNLWMMTGLMLLGMALLKLGVFNARRSPAFYASLAILGFGSGIPLMLYGATRAMANGWDFRTNLAIDNHLAYWGSLLVSLGWIGAIVLVFRLGVATTGPAAVGRLALTNYVMQSLICTAIFYGHGLGLFARVERLGQLALVLPVWGVQLAASSVWLRYFAMGPLEWVWRCLTYRQWVPLRRGAGVTAAGEVG